MEGTITHGVTLMEKVSKGINLSQQTSATVTSADFGNRSVAHTSIGCPFLSNGTLGNGNVHPVSSPFGEARDVML